MVVALAMWLGRLTSVTHVLCLALGTVLVLDPWAVLWPGFWLSFGAVAVLWLASAGGSDGPMGALATAIGLGERVRSFLAGRIALADVLWFTTTAGVAVVLASGAIEVRRQASSAAWCESRNAWTRRRNAMRCGRR